MPAASMCQLLLPRTLLVAVALLLAQLAGCSDPDQQAPPPPHNGAAGIFTIGDIDPDEPATRVRRLQPLADYLAQRLGDHGIGRGRVVIARTSKKWRR